LRRQLRRRSQPSALSRRRPRIEPSNTPLPRCRSTLSSR
jgi:hypothetical protein